MPEPHTQATEPARLKILISPQKCHNPCQDMRPPFLRSCSFLLQLISAREAGGRVVVLRGVGPGP